MIAKSESVIPSGAPQTFRGMRWIIVGLIFAVTCINYIDRSSVGLLVTHFGSEIGVTARQYGTIGALLLFAYTLSQSVSGRLTIATARASASRFRSLCGALRRWRMRLSSASGSFAGVLVFSGAGRSR